MRNEKPSATACLIAASLGFCSRDPRFKDLVNPLAAKASPWFMKAYGAPASWFTGMLDQSWVLKLAYAIEKSTIPGILLHYILRKRFLHETARQYLDQGFRQVVVLGGGFDVLALALHRDYPQTTFIEIDFPATQAAKQAALDSKGLLDGNFVFLPIDFMKQTLGEVLLIHPRYRNELDTLFIAEGVLMYLTQAEVDRLFQFVREHAGPGSRVAFTFMEPRPDGRVNFHNRSRLVDFWMKFRGEPFTWGISCHKMPDYLRQAGFSQETQTTPALFRERYLKTNELAQVPLAEGEYVCVAGVVS